MNFDLLISQYDEHNEEILLLARKFNIRKIVLIFNNNNIFKSKKIKKLYFEVNQSYNLETISIDIGDYNSLKNNLDKYLKDKSIICLNGGERINSLLLLRFSMEYRIESIYLDIKNKKRYVFGKDSRTIEQQLDDMSIDDITKLSGANIIDESSYLCNKSEVVEITKTILANLDLWHNYKQRLYDNSIFTHNYQDTSEVIIHRNLLNDEEKQLLDKVLVYLKKVNGIEYLTKNSDVYVTFKNNYLKGFLFKSGTWLEVLTNIVINEIKEIDEVKSSVTFFWSEDSRCVKNELDVVAVKDSVLLCISCKDSDKYDEDALNELEVYSNRLGGKHCIKILVATKKPIKKSVIDRAKEMNINLVIVDKDINKFRKEISMIIKK